MGEKTWMLYGANGYSGRLIARAAQRRGLRPILAGRSEGSVRALAQELGLPWRSFPLTEAQETARSLAGVAAVLHAAGPFSATGGPMTRACLEAGAHYLDLAGEIPAVQSVLDLHEKARERGVVMIPGVGCDVVPSNCLAAALAEKAPKALSLELVCEFKTTPSRGTMKSVVEQIPLGGMVLRAGRLSRVRHGAIIGKFPSGSGSPKTAMAAPWGDLVAARRVVNAPDITIFMVLPRWLILYAQIFGGLSFLLGLPGVAPILRKAVDWLVVEGSEEDRRMGWLTWRAQLSEEGGRVLRGHISVPDPYAFTADSAVKAVEEVLSGRVAPGAWSPAQALGPGFAAGLPGVSMAVDG